MPLMTQAAVCLTYIYNLWGRHPGKDNLLDRMGDKPGNIRRLVVAFWFNSCRMLPVEN